MADSLSLWVVLFEVVLIALFIIPMPKTGRRAPNYPCQTCGHREWNLTSERAICRYCRHPAP